MRVDRVGACLQRARQSGERLLIPYLTIGDPTPGATITVALRCLMAGADAVELGLPTPAASHSGEEIRRSFARALSQVPDTAAALAVCRYLRTQAPDAPIIILTYRQTMVTEAEKVFSARLRRAGVDALVVADDTDPGLLERVAAGGVSPIPLIRHGTPADLARRLESCAPHLTYRTLAPRTGAELDLAACVTLARTLRATASKPYLLGFGLREPAQIRALAPYGDGFVIGSELLRRLQRVPAPDQASEAAAWVRAWKDACRPERSSQR